MVLVEDLFVDIFVFINTHITVSVRAGGSIQVSKIKRPPITAMQHWQFTRTSTCYHIAAQASKSAAAAIYTNDHELIKTKPGFCMHDLGVCGICLFPLLELVDVTLDGVTRYAVSQPNMHMLPRQPVWVNKRY